MAPIITPEANRLGVAHILKNHINDYQDKYQLWSQHRKIVYDLLNCRTAYLGGRIDRCDHCGAMRIACIHAAIATAPHASICRVNAGWNRRKGEILPTDYFHVVFTLPHALNPIVLNNKKVMLAILFKAASQTLANLW